MVYIIVLLLISNIILYLYIKLIRKQIYTDIRINHYNSQSNYDNIKSISSNFHKLKHADERIVKELDAILELLRVVE